MNVLQKLLIRPIRLYQRFVSPLTPATCRFHPTCSHYAAEAIEIHGAFRGGYLAARRILKCHPFHPGGLDEVPSKQMFFKELREAAHRKPAPTKEVSQVILEDV